MTLPALRRILDAMAAASVAASSIGSTAALASASAPAAPRSSGPTPEAAPPCGSWPPPGRHRTSRELRASWFGGRPPFPTPGRPRPRSSRTPLPAAKPKGCPSQANGFAGLPKGTKVVVVEPGDCLSVLAERHLGDWRLDSEIEALNFGRLQPDGRALVNDHWIYPGWVLVMPPNAVGAQVVGGQRGRGRCRAPAAAHETGPSAACATEPSAHEAVISSPGATAAPAPKRGRRPAAHPAAPNPCRSSNAPVSAGRARRKEAGQPSPGPCRHAPAAPEGPPRARLTSRPRRERREPRP